MFPRILDANDMTNHACLAAALIVLGAGLTSSRLAAADELTYACSTPPTEVRFAIAGGHYSGWVNCGNLFLQTDTPTAPVVRWKQAKATFIAT
jgi:hypothetical protein